MDIHVNTGTPQDTVQKKEIIAGLLVQVEIILEVHGVIPLMVKVGIGVTYQYVEVS
jgi:hypothetical protein